MLQTTIGPKPRKDVVGAAARSAAELAAFRGILAGIAAGGLLWLAIAKLLF